MTDRPAPRILRTGVTVFLGSFLLFLVQPIAGRRILPWYGGSPAVWTTCLVFFQSALLAGYAYAHLLARRASPRRQAVVHGALLAAALLPPVLPGLESAPAGNAAPVPGILALLLRTIGLPFFLLAASGPLLQAWAGRIHPERPPWRLFAVSNAGSLTALVAYPVLVAPELSVTAQARVWKAGLVVFALLVGFVLHRLATGLPSGAPGSGGPADPAADPARGPERPGLWIAWSATAVILFMAVTNQLSLNIASVPFLWTMPLGLYLLSFVVTFSGPAAYPRPILAGLLVVAFVAFWVALPGDTQSELVVLRLTSLQRIVTSGLALFVCCMVCHGELYRLRPRRARLTRYYLAISLGGVVGGVLVGVVAPRAFLLYHELQLGLLACGVLCLLTLRREGPAALGTGRARLAVGMAAVGLAVMAAESVWLTQQQLRETVYTRRNFFGLIRVRDVQDPDGAEHRELGHGSTLHGLQLLGDDRGRFPTIYYGPISGVGLVLRALGNPAGLRVGVIGMGAATVAAYGRANDRYDFYEIDPDMVDVARRYFTFLKDSRAECRVELGDGRLSLERDEDRGYDVIVLDAFSSDAIPVHLLTVEAMRTYERHLKPGGVLAFHISNHYLDLGAVVTGLAEARGFRAMEIENRDEPGGTTRESTWMILARDESLAEPLSLVSARAREAGLVTIRDAGPERVHGVPVWTDERSSLLGILR